MKLAFHTTYHVSLVEFDVMDTFHHGGAYCVGFELNNSSVYKLLDATVRVRIFGYCMVSLLVKGK
jgi:hypothetical protein